MRFCCSFYILICFLILAPTVGAAEERLKAEVSGDLSSFESTWAKKDSQTGDRSAIRGKSFSSKPLELSADILGLEQVSFHFEKTIHKDWPSYFSSDEGMIEDSKQVTLLRGEASFGGRFENVPAAGSLYQDNGTLYAFIHFPKPESAGELEYYEVTVPIKKIGSKARRSFISKETATIRKVSQEELEGKTCAASVSETHSDADEVTTNPSTANLGDTSEVAAKVIELATDADKEFFDRYGSNSNAQIATIVNAADTIYQRDLNLDFEIKTQNVQTSSSQPYTATNASTLLGQFRTNTNSTSYLGTADAYHLFTGKDMDGSTVGIAYVGVLCSYPTYSYGITQQLSSALDYIIFAHEVGHNLNAPHDDNMPYTIMSSYVGSSQNSFSASSSSTISSYVSANGSCLASSTATPTPTSTATSTSTATATATATPTTTSTTSPTVSSTQSPTQSPTPTETPSPTPTPTETPDPTADPRATPDPSDPEDGAPSDDTTSLSLQVRFNRRTGAFRAVYKLSGETGSDCTASLVAADNIAFSKSRSYEIPELTADFGSLQISGLIRTRVKANSKIFFKAVYSECEAGGDDIESEVVTLSPLQATKKQPIETTARWIRRLVSALDDSLSGQQRRSRRGAS
jgi:hypothetical protein